MMETIPLIYEDFMQIRQKQHLSLFAKQKNDNMLLIAQPHEGITITTEISRFSCEWNKIKPFVNKSILFYDKRITSHDFADPATWPATNDSKFVFIPDTGYEFILTHCIVRFPKSLMILPTNKLHYVVYLSLDGKSEPSPVIHLVYEETADLIRKTNTPMYMSPTSLPGVGIEEMVEINFVYADPYTFKGAPIIFRSSLNERIEIYLEANEPFVGVENATLTQECNIILNFKRTLEF